MAPDLELLTQHSVLAKSLFFFFGKVSSLKTEQGKHFSNAHNRITAHKKEECYI